MWKLKAVGCVSCALPELDTLAPLSYICSLQLLLTSWSLHFAVSAGILCDTLAWWTSPSREWKVAPELPAWVLLRFTVSHSTLPARVALWQIWLRRWTCIQFTYSRKRLDCLSCIYSSGTKRHLDEECTQQRRGVGLGQRVGDSLREDSPAPCCLTPKLDMVVVPLR